MAVELDSTYAVCKLTLGAEAQPATLRGSSLGFGRFSGISAPINRTLQPLVKRSSGAKSKFPVPKWHGW